MTFYDTCAKFRCFFKYFIVYKSFVLYVHPIKAFSEKKWPTVCLKLSSQIEISAILQVFKYLQKKWAFHVLMEVLS